MLATTAVAQVPTNKLPEIPPPAVATPAAPPPTPMVAPPEAQTQTNAPAKKSKSKKKIVHKTRTKTPAKSREKMTPAAPVILMPGPATVDAEHLNLRGQAGLKGEVVGHLQKGDSVTVIAEITLDKPKAGEPAQWAKVALPSSIKVWVDAKYVDASNNVVLAKKLNLRGGPGENYSVLGVVEKGTPLTPVITKAGWTQVEPPSGAFAFVAAAYLKQETNAPAPPVAAAPEAVPAPPPAPPTPATVAEAQPIAPPATTPPPAPETPAPVPPPSAEVAPPPAPTPEPPLAALPQPTLVPEEEDTNPPPPRIVTHEGTVRHSVSPVAPTDFELYSPSDDKAINYLYSPTTNLNLSRYNGLHITVTGEEGMDPRWKDTPVLTIQKIYVLSGEKPVLKPVKKHWW